MSNARPTAEQLHKKYQSALQAYARQLADPLLRLDFLQEADPFFRRCALGVWCWGGSITETHVALYNGIYAPDSQPPRALYFEVASGAMAALRPNTTSNSTPAVAVPAIGHAPLVALEIAVRLTLDAGGPCPLTPLSQNPSHRDGEAVLNAVRFAMPRHAR